MNRASFASVSSLAVLAAAGLASAQITLAPAGTIFNSPIGVDYHETDNTLIASVNYSGGQPFNFSRILPDGTSTQFSSAAGFSDEVYFSCVRSGQGQTWTTGETFTGTGGGGEIARISSDGSVVQRNWTVLPNESGLRGNIIFDRTGVFGGDMIVATNSGRIWRVDSTGNASLLAATGAGEIEGLTVVPNNPARYGPLAGKIIGGTDNSLLYSIDAAGTVASYPISASWEAIHLIPAGENFVGVAYSDSRILEAPASDFAAYVGDILVAHENFGVGSSGLSRLLWDGTSLSLSGIALNGDSFIPHQWEHVTFAPTTAPAPGAAGLIGLAALAASRRRR